MCPTSTSSVSTGGTVQANQTGRLSATTITGLNMRSDPLTVDLGNQTTQDFARGITYDNMQVVEVLLGNGEDHFDIDSTAEQTLTVIHGGGKKDTIVVNDSTGPLVLFGDTSANGLRYSATPGNPNGTASGSANMAKTSSMRPMPTASSWSMAGDGKDTLKGGKQTSFIAGGTGDDQITGGLGKNWIIGDSAFDVDYALRTVIIDDKALSAGKDTITGSDTDDVILGDHGLIADEHVAYMLKTLDQSEGTLDMMAFHQVIQVRSTNPSVGGDDIIDAKAGKNIVFGGTGADEVTGTGGTDILFGDNGIAKFVNGKTTEIESTDPTYGGKDKIKTYIGAAVVGTSATSWSAARTTTRSTWSKARSARTPAMPGTWCWATMAGSSSTPTSRCARSSRATSTMAARTPSPPAPARTSSSAAPISTILLPAPRPT